MKKKCFSFRKKMNPIEIFNPISFLPSFVAPQDLFRRDTFFRKGHLLNRVDLDSVRLELMLFKIKVERFLAERDAEKKVVLQLPSWACSGFFLIYCPTITKIVGTLWDSIPVCQSRGQRTRPPEHHDGQSYTT